MYNEFHELNKNTDNIKIILFYLIEKLCNFCKYYNNIIKKNRNNCCANLFDIKWEVEARQN